MKEGNPGRLQRNADLISGIALAVIGLVMLIETRNIRALQIMEFGPRVMPQLYSIALMGLGGAIALSGAIRKIGGDVRAQSSNLGKCNYAKAFLTIALIVLFVVALRPIGFLLTSTLYLFFQFLVLGGAANRWRLVWYAGLAGAIALGNYLLFTQVFNVLLPVGRVW